MTIALFHFHVTQIKRSAGQSAVAAAAYRSGEKLHSEYYGEDSDYTRKGGVVCSEILLPAHAPPEYADREILWNAVEKVERGKKAQLAYSFDIALQNEFSMEENSALARRFLLEQFVSRGMIVDFAVHSPDREGGISNPHFHVLCPIRPIEPNGKWGNKQRREYVLDENGERIPDGSGDYLFNAVPTTDWGSPETLEHWRQAWAELCNAKFAEKELSCRIDHRSYERQGVDFLPTVHEGPTVRAMEHKGIFTEKGEFNRWVKATNAAIRDIRKKIAALEDWLKEVKKELSKPKSPDLVSLLQAYFDRRNAGAYSQKARINNLKEMNTLFNYLMENGIHDLDTLEDRVNTLRESSNALKETLDSQTARMKEIRKLPDYLATYHEMKSVYDGLQKIKFTHSKEKYKADHAAKLKHFYEARRKLSTQFPDGKFDRHALEEEYARLEQEHEETYAQFKSIRADSQQLWKIKSYVDSVRKDNEQAQNRNHQQHLRVESSEKMTIARKQLERNEKRIAELKRLFIKIYEDNAKGKLSDERFDMLSQTYEAEQKQLEAEVITLRKDLEVQQRQNENIEKFIQKAHKYVGIEELDPYALRELVKAIYVDAPVKISGKRTQHIHIQYDGIGFIPLDKLLKEETA